METIDTAHINEEITTDSWISGKAKSLRDLFTTVICTVLFAWWVSLSQTSEAEAQACFATGPYSPVFCTIESVGKVVIPLAIWTWVWWLWIYLHEQTPANDNNQLAIWECDDERWTIYIPVWTIPSNQFNCTYLWKVNGQTKR